MRRDPTLLTRFVVGFAFTEHSHEVALIKKQRPVWQRGFLNGIGGHIEAGETGDMAMAREFEEETGYRTSPSAWRIFAILEHWDKGGLVFFYRANVPPAHEHLITTKTDEPVHWYGIYGLEALEVIPNLHWLIPLAHNEQREVWPVRFNDSPEEFFDD